MKAKQKIYQTILKQLKQKRNSGVMIVFFYMFLSTFSIFCLLYFYFVLFKKSLIPDGFFVCCSFSVAFPVPQSTLIFLYIIGYHRYFQGFIVYNVQQMFNVFVFYYVVLISVILSHFIFRRMCVSMVSFFLYVLLSVDGTDHNIQPI